MCASVIGAEQDCADYIATLSHTAITQAYRIATVCFWHTLHVTNDKHWISVRFGVCRMRTASPRE